MRDTVKILIIFALAFLFVALENSLSKIITISGLIAVMSFGISLNNFYPELTERIVKRFEKIWFISEIMLFVLVGALVDVRVLIDVGLLAIALIILSMIF